jgi:hypothetical protein
MKKEYIVRLSHEERDICVAVIKNNKKTSQIARRASILLEADATKKPNGKDSDIAKHCRCSIQTVQNVRKRYVTQKDVAKKDFEKILADPKYALPKDFSQNDAVAQKNIAKILADRRRAAKKYDAEKFNLMLNRKERDEPPRPRLLTIEQYAEILVLQNREPPAGRKKWTFRLLAEEAAKRGIVPAVSRTTIQKMMKRIIEYGNKLKSKTDDSTKEE